MNQAITRPDLVLASASPRRKDLLQQIGIIPDAIIPAALDETPHHRELPRPHALRLAREKAAHIATTCSRPSLVIGADTVVALGRRILPKTEDEETARHCLRLLSGRRHKVLTAIVLHPAAWPEGHYCERVVETSVIFSRLSERQIDFLISEQDWQGKAGGYALQGMAASFIRQIGGSASSVIGLPLFELAQLLRGQPLPPTQRWIT